MAESIFMKLVWHETRIWMILNCTGAVILLSLSVRRREEEEEVEDDDDNNGKSNKPQQQQ
jgi:hypothetical protein